MSYSKFTFQKLHSKFGLVQEEKTLFSEIDIKLIQPSVHLVQALEESKEMPIYAEKAKSEAIIYPIIRELKRNNQHISIFSGYSFNVDSANGLVGSPDFMISAKPKMVEPESPIFALVETKNNAPHEGFAQCAAEMYAARIFNQQTGVPYETIYGVVTNAFEWVFVKLEGNTVFVDKNRYFINELPKILGIFQYILDQYK